MISHDKTEVEKDTLRSNQDQEGTKYERTEMLIGPEVTTKQAWEFFSNDNRKGEGICV
jgi:hypothetical protein